MSAFRNWWKRFRGYEAVAVLEERKGGTLIRWIAHKESLLLEKDTNGPGIWTGETICRNDPSHKKMRARVFREGKHGWLKRNVPV